MFKLLKSLVRGTFQKTTIRGNQNEVVQINIENNFAGVDYLKEQINSTSDARLKRFFESYLDSETGPVPFGGRGDEISLLDRWLNDPLTPNRMLITAPAGRGKSAILVHWASALIRHVSDDHRKIERHVIFVPISIRFGTNLPSTFYKIISQKLAFIFSETIPTPAVDPQQFYADQARAYLDRIKLGNIRIVLIVDGIDEALGGNFDTSIFPIG